MGMMFVLVILLRMSPLSKLFAKWTLHFDKPLSFTQRFYHNSFRALVPPQIFSLNRLHVILNLPYSVNCGLPISD
ncbi:hypothetical protein F4782DRAFT_499893 [Xylaria castorea]|nr:hypothetical protein F4782DRAFT_499893 [Xylaria castorea]